MGIVRRYVRWVGHDAGGMLPPLTVCAGVLADEGARVVEERRPGEALVLVPPQWVGDWETGRPLPVGYQYLWRAPEGALLPTADMPPDDPYRPLKLPPAACGPSFKRPPPRAARQERGAQRIERQDE